MRRRAAVLAVAMLVAQAPTPAAAAADKEVWTSIGTAGNGDGFALDYSRAVTTTNEFGGTVTRIWLQISLVDSPRGDVRRLSYYEVDCANHAGRVLDGISYDRDGNVTDRYRPPNPNPMEQIKDGTMATRIYKLVCKAA